MYNFRSGAFAAPFVLACVFASASAAAEQSDGANTLNIGAQADLFQLAQIVPPSPADGPVQLVLAASAVQASSADTGGAPDAADVEPPVSGLTLSANATIATEYRFRGVNLSGGDIAIQGGFDASHSSGFYAGTWASSLDEDTVGYGFIELDLYGGWSGAIADGLTGDIGFIAYTYPNAGPGDFDYYEIYGSLGFAIGPASTTVGVAYDPEQDGLDFGGLTRDNLYIYTDIGVPISGTPITLNGHLGYTDGSLTFTQDSKSFDWLIGADWALNDKFTLNVSYIDAEADVGVGMFNPTSSVLLASITASF